MSLDEDGETNKISLIMELRKQGIRSNDVLSAIERVPRDEFISTAFKAKAYDNHPLPIECGQTISQPFVVAYMTEQLRVGSRMKVLEIGTGSGYQAAILSHLCRRVYTIERYRTLMRDAVNRLEGIRIHNVTAMVGDGVKGWPEQAPFDRIIVTAAAEAIPLNLLKQLKVGGIMIVPVDNPQRRGEQKLLRLTRTDLGFEQEDLLDVRFVPLVEGVAREG